MVCCLLYAVILSATLRCYLWLLLQLVLNPPSRPPSSSSGVFRLASALPCPPLFERQRSASHPLRALAGPSCPRRAVACTEYPFITTPLLFSPSFRSDTRPTRQHVDNFQTRRTYRRGTPLWTGTLLSARDVHTREAVSEVTLCCLGPLNPRRWQFALGLASRIAYDTTASHQVHHHHFHKLVTNPAFSLQIPTSLRVA